MIYNLKNEFQLQQFNAKCEHYRKNGRIVELKLRPEPKSYPQLKYLHVLLKYVASEVGYDEDYVKTNYFKAEANKEMFLRESTDKVTGRIIVLSRSCASLSKEEMTTAIERFRNWASMTIGIYLPEPHETELLAEAERQIERDRNFL